MKAQLLDLCCGLGGWSVGFHRAGFTCQGVDVIDLGYPYRLTLADVRTWSPRDNSKIQVITASPPCTEFSALTRLAIARGQRGPVDIPSGLEIVQGCVRIIEKVKPTFWIMENVHGSEQHINPILGKPKIKRGPWRLWGEFPVFLLPENPELKSKLSPGITSIRSKDKAHDRLNSVFAYNPLRSWFRSKIPLPLSIPLGQACMKELKK